MSASALTTVHSGAASVERRLVAVAIWLFACCALIFLMVVVGGITRLTLSGLSITEWKPVIGVLPPLSAADWADRVRTNTSRFPNTGRCITR